MKRAIDPSTTTSSPRKASKRMECAKSAKPQDQLEAAEKEEEEEVVVTFEGEAEDRSPMQWLSLAHQVRNSLEERPTTTLDSVDAVDVSDRRQLVMRYYEAAMEGFARLLQQEQASMENQYWLHCCKLELGDFAHVPSLVQEAAVDLEKLWKESAQDGSNLDGKMKEQLLCTVLSAGLVAYFPERSGNEEDDVEEEENEESDNDNPRHVSQEQREWMERVLVPIFREGFAMDEIQTSFQQVLAHVQHGKPDGTTKICMACAFFCWIDRDTLQWLSSSLEKIPPISRIRLDFYLAQSEPEWLRVSTNLQALIAAETNVRTLVELNILLAQSFSELVTVAEDDANAEAFFEESLNAYRQIMKLDPDHALAREMIRQVEECFQESE